MNERKKNVFKVLEEYADSDEEDDRPAEAVQSPKRKKVHLFKAALLQGKAKREKASFQAEDVSILTYNVLADHLCKPNWFKYRGKAELDWRTRREVIKKTILDANADIICLQEVQMFVGPEHIRGTDHHLQWFDTWLRQEGYTGCSGARSNANGKPEQGIQIGNLLYWKDKKFKPLLVESSVSLLKTIAEAVKGSKEMRSLFCGSGARGTTSSMVALRCARSGRVMVLATTHLPAPRSDADGSSKLEQLLHAYALIREVSRFVKRVKEGVDLALVCGDLNAMPGSDVLHLIETGFLPKQRVLKALRAGRRYTAPFLEKERLVLPPIDLRSFETESTTNSSVYMTNLTRLALNGREPAFTNATDEFKGWLDHIYIAAGPGCLAECSSTDPSAGLPSNCMLPDPANGHGSDHLPLLCRFRLHPCPLLATEHTVTIQAPRDCLETISDEDIDKIEAIHVADQEMFDRTVAELNLDALDSSSEALCIDVQAASLSRNAPVSLLVVKRVGLHVSTSYKPILFDVLALGWKKSGVPSIIKDLLESDRIVKLSFDVRLDSDMLFHNLECTLRNVLDLQIVHQGIRLSRGEELPEKTQTWRPRLWTLSKTATTYLDASTIGQISRAAPPGKNSREGWNQRPLLELAMDFAASQVCVIEAMFRKMRDIELSDEVRALVELHSRRAVEDFRSRTKAVLPEEDTAIVLEELSIRLPWASQEPSYLEKWKTIQLLD